MRKTFGILLTLLFCLVALSATAQEDDAKLVTVTGEGVIFNNDQATAEAKAIENGLRAAVEQVVGVYISADTLVQNYVTVSDRILSQSTGYVKSYTKKDSKVVDGVVVVTLEVAVSRAKLKGDLDELKAALARKNFPRMMLLIGEQNVGQSGYSQWWGNTAAVISMGVVENTLIDVLGDVGFSFVDPDVLKGKITQTDAYKVESGNGLSTQAAREIANLTDAQVVITGTAVAVDAGKVMGTDMHSGQADITVRAINTDNGEILFSASAKATVANVNPVRAGQLALEKASKDLSQTIIAKITKKWLEMRQTVTIKAAGIASYQMLDDFSKALSHQIAGVQGVMVRRMDKSDAMLDVIITGSLDLLARDLAQKSFTGFLVRVDGVTANQLSVTLIKQ
jgi:hypothetical protein